LHTVHPEDADQWGVLVKTDRNNKIPCDVLVWLGDQNHVDVCDSQGGIWIPHGNIAINGGGRWSWAPADVVDPNGEERALYGPPYALPDVPAPQPNPGTPSPDSGGPSPEMFEAIKAALLSVDARVAALQDQVSGLAAVVSALSRQGPATFPDYEGDVAIKYLGTGRAYLRPKQ
jgi:hypothetical protein